LTCGILIHLLTALFTIPFTALRREKHKTRIEVVLFSRCAISILSDPARRGKQLLTTFLLLQGRFCFLRAPMGMKNLSDVFCHRTDDILSYVPDIIRVVDDLLLQAETEDELLSILRF
jgi:hypothetical protein